VAKTTAVQAADRSQAEYFRCLLAEHRADIEASIVEYLEAMDRHKSRDEVASIRELARLVRQSEQERQRVDSMIAALDRRFPGSDAPATDPPSLVRHLRSTRVG
jgi:hypothetical protein